MILPLIGLILLSFQALAQGDLRAESLLSSDTLTNLDCTRLYNALTEIRPQGPHIRVPFPSHPSPRSLESLTSLQVMQYNPENLFNQLGKVERDLSGQASMVRPELASSDQRWSQLGRNIRKVNPDIVTLQEVENLQAARQFVNQELGNQYHVYLVEGNDQRGIDLALLVKKDLPIDITLQSHRSFRANGDRPLFTRDLMVAEIRPAGASPQRDPLLVIANTHNKSQRDSPGDPRSVAIRTKQVEEQARILKKWESAYPNSPVLLQGDMNADVRTAPEFRALWERGYRDSFDLAPQSIPKEERITQSYFPQDGPPVYNQLDGIFASRRARDLNMIRSMDVVADTDRRGNALPLPRSFEERKLQASDHRAISMTLDFQTLWRNWNAHPSARGEAFGPLQWAPHQRP